MNLDKYDDHDFDALLATVLHRDVPDDVDERLQKRVTAFAERVRSETLKNRSRRLALTPRRLI